MAKDKTEQPRQLSQHERVEKIKSYLYEMKWYARLVSNDKKIEETCEKALEELRKL